MRPVNAMLALVAKHQATLNQSIGSSRYWLGERDRAIRATYAAGVRPGEIAKAAGIGRQQVHKILKQPH